MALTSIHVEFVPFAKWLVVVFHHINAFVPKRYLDDGAGIAENIYDTSVC